MPFRPYLKKTTNPSRIAATFYKNGIRIKLTPAALEAIGDPDYIVPLLDPDAGEVAFRAAEKTENGARRLSEEGHFAASGFALAAGLSTDSTTFLPLEARGEGMLVGSTIPAE